MAVESQRSGGVWGFLRSPKAYLGLQRLLARHSHGLIVAEYIRPTSGMRILDMGCGPAEYLAYLPAGVVYTGVDMSEEYIAAATARYGSRATFIRGSFQAAASSIQGPFDVILATGFLHHLDDATAREFVGFSAARLSDAGRLITIDGAYRDGQNPIARLILSLDRGRHVRPVREMEALLSTHFSVVRLHVREDLLRIPYTHLIAECGMPKTQP